MQNPEARDSIATFVLKTVQDPTGLSQAVLIYLRTSRLVALPKDNGDARPLAIQNAFAAMVDHLVKRMLPMHTLNEVCGTLPLGIAQQGSERTATVLRHHINSPLTIAQQVLLNDMPIPNGKAVRVDADTPGGFEPGYYIMTGGEQDPKRERHDELTDTWK